MIDIDKGTENAGKVDKLLTSWGNVFKKHWGKFIIIGVVLFIYWAFTLEPTPETIDDNLWEYELNEYGDTTWYYDGVVNE